ncbi:MAG: isochorismate synthase [Actinobacteria bacterium]|uniref:isochorismate synthase n=1 Tax=freshwater metagenome TaxID=449393 RepID=A0A6J7TTT3_9ZZZZ|nr:isochorismate synthase [Actinomycetota bacterium]MSW47332.1 isochorismate synthase [Actinomycetota bacterium]MSX24811.1 isochorismate synthase [Actinomycetota bacterium]MSY46217.1 isochorismate synthase [Actinomycetota bacterium]MSY56781.1 isochorismate synthase [Actinomycetota bacterium]
MSPLISVTTARLGDHLPLLDLLPDAEPLSWVRNGEGLVGWGVHATTTISGANRFREARAWWHQQLEAFAITDSVHSTGTGPILFSSFSFSPEEDSVLVIPKVVVGTRGSNSWITWIGEEAQPNLLGHIESLTSPQYSWRDGTISAPEWQSKVAEAITAIGAGEIEKVVLARDLVASAASAIDPRLILRNLSANYPSTWTFAVDGLVGATPELLLRLNRGMVTSRVLAGTIRRTGDDEKDLALAASLARSSKDLEEHDFAVRSVADSLATFCPSTNVPDSPFVLHLANVMHLATDVTGAVADTPQRIDVFSILEKLHPSAAVCGTPTESAAKVIARLEGMSRQRYAGPVGWIDAKGDGELGIALRCGQIEKNEIRLFAGCGIVSGSIPEREFAESQVKFLPMESALQESS